MDVATVTRNIITLERMAPAPATIVELLLWDGPRHSESHHSLRLVAARIHAVYVLRTLGSAFEDCDFCLYGRSNEESIQAAYKAQFPAEPVQSDCDCHLLPTHDMDGSRYAGVCKKCEERMEAGYDTACPYMSDIHANMNRKR